MKSVYVVRLRMADGSVCTLRVMAKDAEEAIWKAEEISDGVARSCWLYTPTEES